MVLVGDFLWVLGFPPILENGSSKFSLKEMAQKVTRGLVTVNPWPRTSENYQKRLWPVKKTSTGPTGPVNIWGHSCFKTSFPSRMSPNVFEINDNEMTM